MILGTIVHLLLTLKGYMTKYLPLFIALFYASSANATVPVANYFSKTPVAVCVPSDSNSNCGGRRIVKKVTTYSTATSITPNSDTDDISYMANSQSVGTFTVNADGGSGQVNGQSWVLKISSTAVQTFSWASVYNGGSLGLPTATLGTSTIQYFTFIWDAVNSKWDYTGSAGGF